MTDFNPRYLADLTIKVSWQDQGHRHQENYFATNFNFYRDVFPGTLLETACDALHDSNTFKVMSLKAKWYRHTQKKMFFLCP